MSSRPTTPSSGPRNGVVLLLAVILVAANLRATLASIPPLIPRIEDDLDLSGAVAGSLTTLPVLAMGLFAPSASALASRIGRESAISVGLGVLLAGLLLRLVPMTPVLLVATLLGGIGIAIVGTLMPGLIKSCFPTRVGTVTGLTMAAMQLGAAVAAGVAVPLDDALGGWSRSAASWSLLALLGLVVWLWVQRSAVHTGTAARGRLPWRDRTARLLAVYLTINSLLFYSMLTWLAPFYEDRGRSAASAGLLLSVFGVVQLVAALSVPALADRLDDRRALFTVILLIVPVGLVGVLVGPDAWAPVSVALLGLGSGASFTMGLVLLADYAPDPHTSARLSGMAFLVSYSLASMGPVAVGALRDASGGFGLPFVVLLAISVAAVALVPGLRPGRMVGHHAPRPEEFRLP